MKILPKPYGWIQLSAGFRFHDRANAFRATGQYALAISDYDQVLQLDPTNGEAFVDRGRAHAKNDQIALAKLDFEAALRIAGNANPELRQAAIDAMAALIPPPPGAVAPLPAPPQTDVKAEQQRQQAALAAEHARELLRAQAADERSQKIIDKMNELGFEVISPIDLELDWPDLAKSGKKVALWGDYTRDADIDGLIVANKDQPVIRLYTDGAPRDARKTMLECRASGATACPMVIGGTVRACVANEKDQRAQAPLFSRTGGVPAARWLATDRGRAEVAACSRPGNTKA